VNHQLVQQRAVAEAAQLPKLGSPITPIAVHGARGPEHALVFKSEARHDHLLLVMSPDCPYCKKNWPMWDALIKEVPSDVDVTYFDVTGKFDKSLSKAHNIKEDQLITAPVDSAMRAHIVGTPTTILIAGNGQVKHVWEGVLDQKQLEEIVDMSRLDRAN
jgi:thiol-disulfide isomerase/thioredoxin